MTALVLERPPTPLRAGAVPTLHVERDAIAANTALLAGRARGALMAVVKADGFGHGAEVVARTALQHGATWLGVTSLAEAGALREAGLGAPILSWLNPVDADWVGAADRDIDVAVPDLAHLVAIRRSGVRRLRVHLHADVGLSRDGAPAADWRCLLQAARTAEIDGAVEVVGLMGHLARADAGPDARGRAAFARFVRLAAAAGLRPRVRHLAATSATLTDPRAHHTLCRVGAGLVGIDPSGTTALRGAATLTAAVVSVRDVTAGTGIGYGHAYVTTRPTRLALLPLGYADGIPSAVAGRAEVLVSGRRCPLVGRISMDQVVADVGTMPVAAGDVAVVFGPGDRGEPTVLDWARWAGTLPHDIVTGLGARIAVSPR
jgi:alanine racemase